MTAEQIATLRAAIEEAERQGTGVTQQTSQPTNPQPQPLEFTYGDQTYTVRTPEELQQQLDRIRQQEESSREAERLRATAEAQAQQTQAAAEAARAQRQAGDQPRFDNEEYATLFLKDPVAAAEYLDRFVPTRQAITQHFAQRIVELEQNLATQQFLSQNPDYEANEDNKNALLSLLQQYSLPFNLAGLSLAYTVGKSGGVFTSAKGSDDDEPTAAQTRQPVDQELLRGLPEGLSDEEVQDFIALNQNRRTAPPRVPSRSRRGSASEQAEYLDRFENLTADQMKAALLDMKP